MATDYYDKTYEEVHALDPKVKLDYYANNPDLYNKEMERVNSVLAERPDHTAGFRWKTQLMEARNKALNNYNKYDLTKPSNITTIQPTYQNEIKDLLSQITNAAQMNANIDVTKDPRYQAQMDLMKENVRQGQNQTMEQMNERGLLMSDMTNDRMAQVETAGMNQLNAIVPDLYDSIVNQNQTKFQNLLNSLGAYQTQSQVDFNQALAKHQAAFNEALQAKNYNLAVDEWIFNKDLSERKFNIEKQQNTINNALNTLNTVGYVTDQEMADILGVPVGTKSSAAREAALNRANQLEMQRISIAAQDNADKGASINELLNIWQTSGEAPPGLEAFGVKPGTPLNQSAIEKLQELLAVEETATLKSEIEMRKHLPKIQEQYGVGTKTAEVIYKLWEMPTYDSAIDEMRIYDTYIKENDIDTNKVIEALETKYGYEAPERVSFFENILNNMRNNAEADNQNIPYIDPKTFYLPY